LVLLSPFVRIINIAELHQAYHIEPRHDAMMLEDTVMVEFESSAAEYYGKME